MGTTLRQFLKIYGPLALSLIILGTWFLHSRNLGHVLVAEERENAIVAQVGRLITGEMTSRASDVQFLARLVSRHVSEKGISRLAELEDAFSDFSRSRQSYFILRYLDEQGMERVRVDRSFSGPVVSPEKALQFKGGRYYFKETMRAGKNDVYVSNFDLNIEHGRIEVPYRPTLRFGCPVYDRAGRKRGVVVLNFDGRAMLDKMKLMADGSDGGIMLTNGDGFWMLGLTPDDEWAHILEEEDGVSMGKRFPEAWTVVSSNEKAQVQTDSGLFTFETIDILPGAILSDVPPSVEEAQRRWKVVTWVPTVRLQVPWKTLFLLTASVLLGLLAMGCWQLADNRVHQDEVEAQLRDNEERTMAISQASRDAIVMINSQGEVTHWNPAAETLLGHREGDVLGQRLHDLIAAPDLSEQARKGLRHFAETGEGVITGKMLEFNAIHKNGSSIPIELAASAFQFKGEWYSVGSMRDTSGRMSREMELRRSEETSRALINAPTDSAMLVEPNGIIVAINEIGARRLGGSPTSLVGQNAYTLFAPGFTDKHLRLISKVREEGVPVTFEDQRGERRMLINIYPVTLEDGGVDRLAIFARDVTEQRLAEEALVRSEQRFRDVSEAVSDIIWETDKSGLLTHITEDVAMVLGYSVKELVGTTPTELIPEEDRRDLANWLSDTVGSLKPFTNVDFQAVTKGGRLVWLEISGRPYFDSEAQFLGYRGAAMDISDRKATENAIKASERKLRALAESAYDAIVMIDSQGEVSFWNDAAEQLFGYSEAEAIGNNVHNLIAPHEDRETVDEAMTHFARMGEDQKVGAVTELSVMHKDGTLFPVERSISSFRLGTRWYAVATIRDITERKATEAKLRELATTDSLTGLFNRRRFMELCDREYSRSLRYDRALSMFMLDIDHFKRVNDAHGHDVGDQVLRAISETSIMALRGADIIGRIGGEEFAVLLPETENGAALEVAERLRLSIERTNIETSAGPLSVTVSIGISSMAPDITSVDKLLKRADVALYDAKQSGRNRVVVGI